MTIQIIYFEIHVYDAGIKERKYYQVKKEFNIFHISSLSWYMCLINLYYEP